MPAALRASSNVAKLPFDVMCDPSAAVTIKSVTFAEYMLLDEFLPVVVELFSWVLLAELLGLLGNDRHGLRVSDVVVLVEGAVLYLEG